MSIVGTNIGNVHRERQGTGYATVLQNDQSGARAAQAASASAKNKRLIAAHKNLLSLDPDNWYTHDAQVQKMIGGYIDMGGQMISEGIDPFSSTDNRSIEFQKLQKRIKGYVNASKQMREDWTKLSTAYKTREQREKVANWDEIAEYYADPDITGIVNEGKLPPKVKFKAPVVDTVKQTSGIVNGWIKNNPNKVVGREDAEEMYLQVSQNPAMTEGIGGGYMGVMKQAYNTLPEEQRTEMENAAHLDGKDGFQVFFEDRFMSYGASVNLTDKAAAIGKGLTVSTTKIEKGSVTTTTKGFKGGDRALRQRARALVISNDGQVGRDVKAGVYGRVGDPVEDNMKAAEDYYFDIIKENMRKDFGRSEDEVGKAATSAAEKNRANKQYWLEAMRGMHGETARNEARNAIIGAQESGGIITNTFPKSTGFSLSVEEKTDDLDEEGRPKRIAKRLDIPVEGVPDSELEQYYERAEKAKGKGFFVKPQEPELTNNVTGFSIFE